MALITPPAPIMTSVAGQLDRLPRPRTAESRTWALALVSLAFAGLLVTVPNLSKPLYDAGGWPILLVLLGFVISEPMVFHIEARNEAVSFSPSDIPLAFGLLMLPPPLLLAIRLCSAAVALHHWRRQPLFKLSLNLGAFTVETVVATILTRFLLTPGQAAGPAMWAGLILAMMAGLVAGGMVIATAISFFEKDTVARVSREVTHSYLFYLPGAVLAASTTVPLLVDAWLVLVTFLPAPLVWVVLRSHGALLHSYADLSEIHAFSSRVGQSPEIEDIARTAVAEIASHLRSGTVALVSWHPTGGVVDAHVGERELLDGLPTSAGDERWASVLEGDAPQVLPPSLQGLLPATYRWSGTGTVAAMGLHGASGPIGIVVVADRYGASPRFDAQDLQRLVPLGQQLSVALAKGQLHLEIQHRALHDVLTGLPNRAYFTSWAAQHLDTTDDTRAAVMVLDLDGFKEVNDTLGHQAGDLLLCEVSRRLADAIADGDVVARFGGDEFAVLVPDIGPDEVALLAEVISNALEEPITIAAATVSISGSIGIATAPVHGSDCETLLRHADMAMYDAKRRHERWTVYRDDLGGHDSFRLSMLADLRNALNDRLIDVHFQPKKDLRTGRIAGVEALARWTDPLHGVVPPEVFVSLAEQAGLIGPLTRLVLADALAGARQCLEHGHRIGVAVNLSAHSLVDESLPRTVADCLTASGVPAELLTLEITESAMVGDSPRTREVLEQLDALGVRISIDDFGTGYSSLVNLRHLPISELKIDRGFVSEMLVRGNDEVLVGSTIDLGRSLGMTVVAEGVETSDVEDRLRQAGCDVAQGYGICRPLTLPQLAQFLAGAGTDTEPFRREYIERRTG